MVRYSMPTEQDWAELRITPPSFADVAGIPASALERALYWCAVHEFTNSDCGRGDAREEWRADCNGTPPWDGRLYALCGMLLNAARSMPEHPQVVDHRQCFVHVWRSLVEGLAATRDAEASAWAECLRAQVHRGNALALINTWAGLFRVDGGEAFWKSLPPYMRAQVEQELSLRPERCWAHVEPHLTPDAVVARVRASLAVWEVYRHLPRESQPLVARGHGEGWRMGSNEVLWAIGLAALAAVRVMGSDDPRLEEMHALAQRARDDLRYALNESCAKDMFGF